MLTQPSLRAQRDEIKDPYTDFNIVLYLQSWGSGKI